MTDFSIKVQNISKEYNLGTISSGTLSRDITKIFYKYTGLEDPNKKIFNENVLDEKDSSGRIIALKNISFKVKEGEIIGVIGKNGAGKSTLLKILSRITSPTLGSVEIKGRLSSLLEVGTGFHPELTGMENIYLNGSIMGMTKIEIDNSLNQIIEFSGIKKFIDTPVKRYSTGMRVRLGFSVAAHLNPEILLIDEVLAVGDAEFQKKCLGKIKDISSFGRTVLFVSHNLSAIRTICDRAILLDKGNLVYDGLTKDTLKFYRKEILKPFSSSVKYNQFQNDITLKEISISKKEIISGDSFTFNFCFENNNNKDAASGITFHLVDEYDNLVFVGGSSKNNIKLNKTAFNGVFKISCKIPNDLMNEGIYTIKRLLYVKDRGNIIFEINDCFTFSILPKQKDFGWIGEKEEGIINPNLEWSIENFK